MVNSYISHESIKQVGIKCRQRHLALTLKKQHIKKVFYILPALIIFHFRATYYSLKYCYNVWAAVMIKCT